MWRLWENNAMGFYDPNADKRTHRAQETPTDLPCPWWSEDLLRREYIDRDRTQKEICERWDITSKTLHRWLKNHGIEKR